MSNNKRKASGKDAKHTGYKLDFYFGDKGKSSNTTNNTSSFDDSDDFEDTPTINSKNSLKSQKINDTTQNPNNTNKNKDPKYNPLKNKQNNNSTKSTSNTNTTNTTTTTTTAKDFISPDEFNLRLDDVVDDDKKLNSNNNNNNNNSKNRNNNNNNNANNNNTNDTNNTNNNKPKNDPNASTFLKNITGGKSNNSNEKNFTKNYNKNTNNYTENYNNNNDNYKAHNDSYHKPNNYNNHKNSNNNNDNNNDNDSEYNILPSDYFPTKHSQEDSGGKYVKMPYDPKNTYICPHTSEKRPKWELITCVLRERILSSFDFQEALLAYNPTYREEWSFIGLHQCIKSMEESEKNTFFTKLLPAIVELALSLPSLIDSKIPLFLPGSSHQQISLSQRQIASLLANAFLCTFPRRNKSPKGYKHYGYSNWKNNNNSNNYGHNEGGADNMPSINFSGLFGKSGKVVVNKLRCILNYFKRVTGNHSLDGVVDFERRQINKFPSWDDSPDHLQSLHVYSEGAIEDSNINYLRVDFANKIIGGGVLGRGCVQEEIMFCVFPELIIARLFNSMLSDSECCIFTGAERFSSYAGYSDSFVFLGDFKDKTPRDENNRRRTQNIDALNFRIARDQFDQRPIHRELNKCYSAFFNYNSIPPTEVRAIATGNWGCGAFNGDLELKAIIQLMAAATAKRTLHYFTFENSVFAANLGSIHHSLAVDGISVGELWSALLIFCTEKNKRREDQTIDATSGVFNFLQLYFANKKM